MSNSFPRTAFLIMAHEHPTLLRRLVDKLDAPWTEIIIHIDRKINITIFEDALAGCNVVFLPDQLRVDIRWGGISQCRATLQMLRYAMDLPCDRFCLLSGVDYPVKPLSSIGQVFSSDTEFIAVERKLRFDGDTHFDRYIGRLSLKEFDMFNPRSTSLPLFSKLARGLAYQIRRKPIAEPQIYHGSSWWSITRRAAQSIVEFTDRRPEFLSWLKLANCPDELLVQSILMAGPFATAISQDFTKFSRLDTSERHVLGCHYVDWTNKNSSSPKTLDLSDLSSICGSSALFARKIHPTISGPLLDALDFVTLQRGLNSLSAGEGDGSGRGGSSGPV